MGLNLVPLAVSLVPFAGIHACYLLAAYSGHVPWCIPYIDACTAISATGRELPESILFRATIIPSAALMPVYWTLVHEWLKALGSPMAQTRWVMLAFGLVASLGLIAYASVLGEIGDAYSLQRRIGVRLFFGFTILAQLLMALMAEAEGRAQERTGLMWAARALLGVTAATIIAGLVSLYLWAYYTHFDSIEHAFAWWVTLLVLVHPLVVFFVWKRSGFRARFSVSGG